MNSQLSLLLFLCVFSVKVCAQPASQTENELPDPKVAFLKSLVVPGWGHYYVNRSNWQRGQYHLAAEAALMLSYVGFSIHSNNLQHNWYAYGRKEAGVLINGRSRRFQLAVGEFNSLEAYNDYQLRSRNWDRLYDDVPQNRWKWSGSSERVTYNDMRSRFETIDQQLPALLALMAVNRIISGISAYNRAMKRSRSGTYGSSLYLSPYYLQTGIVANLKVEF